MELFYFLASYIITFLPTENFVAKRTLVTSLLFPKMEGVALASRTKTRFNFHQPGLFLMLL